MHNKNILLTGGAGFIGSHLVDILLGLDIEHTQLLLKRMMDILRKKPDWNYTLYLLVIE